MAKPNAPLQRVSVPTDNKAEGNSFDSAGSEVVASDTIFPKGKMPLWSTMALFASLAANLFFGWIAWDTHSRYQDFVEEMSETETRVERRSRRLRDESPAGTSSTLRTREQDEADFLRGGIEV